MNRAHCLMAALVFAGLCAACSPQESSKKQPRALSQQEIEIENLIEQLVFNDPKASRPPGSDSGAGAEDAAIKKECAKCEEAFRKLTEHKEASLPLLLEHLGDQRPSVPFRHHFVGHSVGFACYWNIYDQLMDTPPDYSSYGLVREGRDGKDHEKPNQGGGPFSEVRGPQAWLEQNKHLSYVEKQIKCLEWMLAKEKEIGAADAESYFKNILPLEIRILERKLDTGVPVQSELHRLRKILREKIVSEIPPELLPDKPANTDPPKPQ